MTGVLAVYLGQILAGLALTAALAERGELSFPERLARACVLGPAAVALELQLLHVVGLPFTPAVALLPWCAALPLVARAERAPSRRREPTERRVAELAVLALFAAALATGLLVPVLDGDGLWNFAVVARILETEGSLAPEVLASTVEAGHVEYPPLVAANEALLFRAAGAARALAVKPFFALAFLALGLATVELAFRLVRARLALPLALAFVLAPFAFRHAAGDLADLRLVAALALALAELARFRERPSARRLAAVAAALGAGALTKNEGIAIALLALPALLALARRRGIAVPALGLAAAIALVAALAWPLWKLAHGIEDVYLHGAAAEPALPKLARLDEVLAHFASLPLARLPNGVLAWGLLWPVTGLLCLAALALGGGRRALGLPIVLLALHALLYALVFALTPRPLDWHLGTAAGRLALHLYPALLLAACAALGALDRAKETSPEAAAATSPRWDG